MPFHLSYSRRKTHDDYLTTGRNGFPAVAPGTRLLGEVISWTCPAVTVRHRAVIEALRDAGLDESVARELAPRHAFSRACKKLARERIIRPVREDQTTITFQFTRESREGDRFEYELETLLTLEKATGKVTCDLPGLATLAQEHLDECIAARNGGDVTALIQRLFERSADLFPIREQGGVYFTPAEHAAFVDRVQAFLGKVNGRLARFPVPAGTPHGDRSVKDAVAGGIAALIEEHRAAVATFGADTRESTLERAAERIRLTRHKIEAYACYLAEEREPAGARPGGGVRASCAPRWGPGRPRILSRLRGGRRRRPAGFVPRRGIPSDSAPPAPADLHRGGHSRFRRSDAHPGQPQTRRAAHLELQPALGQAGHLRRHVRACAGSTATPAASSGSGRRCWPATRRTTGSASRPPSPAASAPSWSCHDVAVVRLHVGGDFYSRRLRPEVAARDAALAAGALLLLHAGLARPGDAQDPRTHGGAAQLPRLVLVRPRDRRPVRHPAGRPAGLAVRRAGRRAPGLRLAGLPRPRAAPPGGHPPGRRARLPGRGRRAARAGRSPANAAVVLAAAARRRLGAGEPAAAAGG